MALIVGHRGARNLWPENSMDGFRRTIALGVKAIELDVHRTHDGALVVIHDPTLERTTSAQGAVGDLPASTVCRAVLRDGNGECVPTLAEVLDVLVPAGIEMQIEIKADARGYYYNGIEAEILALVESRDALDRSLLTCFQPDVLERVHALRPQQRLLASLDRRSCEMLGGLETSLARFAALPGCVLAVEKALLQHALAPCLHRFGADRLGVWVLNEPEEYAAWRDTPLRQITTDRPDIGLK